MENPSALRGLYPSRCDHVDAGYEGAGAILSPFRGWLTVASSWLGTTLILFLVSPALLYTNEHRMIHS